MCNVLARRILTLRIAHADSLIAQTETLFDKKSKSIQPFVKKIFVLTKCKQHSGVPPSHGVEL